MVEAFRSEVCRRTLEQIIWSNGRLCPFCDSKRARSRFVAGTAAGRRALALYQCQNQARRHCFTATTKTPTHATKLLFRKTKTGAIEQVGNPMSRRIDFRC